MAKVLKKSLSKVLFLLAVLGSIGAAYTQKVYANYYSPWVVISVSGVKQRRIIYNGTKPLIQLYQNINYRRTFTDRAGRRTYQYKTEIRNIGLKSPYAP
ncbi:hypothetical protein [Streptococcus cuniculipharyngis]|uniref:Uncharacterized protein n=1 Tax=Streptococcus cuniculipharyngis TaxID=1562651 RepID=A0A5C5SA07_9STRE|nr:hypothetical protein [Streptococcus cuniculipharyngis]TWS97429.1 hypothetical protein FRX57_05785 [Streptococcus cuniculipharyngis]